MTTRGQANCDDRWLRRPLARPRVKRIDAKGLASRREAGTPLCRSRHGGPPKRATKLVDANSPLKTGDGYSPMDGVNLERAAADCNPGLSGGTAQIHNCKRDC